jgi:hypothetical protein
MATFCSMQTFSIAEISIAGLSILNNFISSLIIKLIKAPFPDKTAFLAK